MDRITAVIFWRAFLKTSPIFFDLRTVVGARIHFNHGGGGDPGAYDTQCRQLDAFVWTMSLSAFW